MNSQVQRVCQKGGGGGRTPELPQPRSCRNKPAHFLKAVSSHNAVQLALHSSPETSKRNCNRNIS